MSSRSQPIIGLLHWCADHGRWFLVAGLVGGVFIQPLAVFLKDYIAEMAIALLFLAAFRVGFKAAVGAAREFRFAIGFVLALQILLPVLLYWVLFGVLGWRDSLATAIVLMAAGSSVSASPHLAVMTGHDPAPALRVLVIGTALLPLTIIPTLWLLPQFQDVFAVIAPSFRLFVVIGISAALAFFLRRSLFPNAGAQVLRAADGLSAIVLCVIVIGLMAAVGPALTQEPSVFWMTMLAAFVANFGLQILCFFLLSGEKQRAVQVPLSIVAGNRNMALFLTALPLATLEPLLLFIGVYQIPMYLTPILLARFYRKA